MVHWSLIYLALKPSLNLLPRIQLLCAGGSGHVVSTSTLPFRKDCLTMAYLCISLMDHCSLSFYPVSSDPYTDSLTTVRSASSQHLFYMHIYLYISKSNNFLYFAVSVCVCTVPCGCLWKPEPPAAGIISTCELLNVGAAN